MKKLPWLLLLLLALFAAASFRQDNTATRPRRMIASFLITQM